MPEKDAVVGTVHFDHDSSAGTTTLRQDGGAASLVIGKGTATVASLTTTALTVTNLTATTPTLASARTRRLHVPPNEWSLGATPPTATSVGTYRGLTFDADAETANVHFRVPSDWDAASDLSLVVSWTNQASTAVGDGETVIFLGSLRSKAAAEVLTAGTAASLTTTYTQSGAGTDLELHETTLTIDYDHASQPLAAGDIVGITVSRDMTTDTYAADIHIVDARVEYQSTAIAVE